MKEKYTINKNIKKLTNVYKQFERLLKEIAQKENKCIIKGMIS